MSEHEPTIKDLLVAMTSMEERLRADMATRTDVASMRADITSLRADMATRTDMTSVRTDMSSMEERLRTAIQETHTESMEAVQSLANHMDDCFTAAHTVMATKEDLRASEHRVMDYVDRKVDTPEATLVSEIRRVEDRGNGKIRCLVDILQTKDVITKEDVQRVARG